MSIRAVNHAKTKLLTTARIAKGVRAGQVSGVRQELEEGGEWETTALEIRAKRVQDALGQDTVARPGPVSFVLCGNFTARILCRFLPLFPSPHLHPACFHFPPAYIDICGTLKLKLKLTLSLQSRLLLLLLLPLPLPGISLQPQQRLEACSIKQSHAHTHTHRSRLRRKYITSTRCQ